MKHVMNNKNRSVDGDAAGAKVIHVIFGPNGGRVSEPVAGTPIASGEQNAGEPQADAQGVLPFAGREPVSDWFSGSEVRKLLNISAGRLRALDRAGIVKPSARRKGRRAYTFSDIIALRAARDLLSRKVRLKDVARAIENIRTTLPKVTRPLSELRIVSDGQRVVVKSREGAFEPLTGQMVLDFDVRDLRDDVVRVLRPVVGKERARAAYELYVRANELDEMAGTIEEAEALYRRAVEIDPYLAIAYTNLGNICFRRNDEAEAEALYRKALEIDVVQPEAQYNLGYLMLENGRAAEAVDYFRGAIRSDPRFADAYFNLAMAYEQLGEPENAQPCWRRYLEIEPSGTWAEIARKHL